MDARSAGYITSEVRRFDYDRYLGSLFAPGEQRAGLWALYGFILEISHIKHRVSEPLAGAIRFQWWRDALEQLAVDHAAGREHPVLEALAPCLASGQVSAGSLQELLLLGEQDFQVSLSASPLPEALSFGKERLGRMAACEFKVAVQVLGVEPDDDFFRDKAGLAWGLTRSLKGERESGMSATTTTGGTRDMITEARDALACVREGLGKVPPAVWPSILHLALVDPWLDRLESASDDKPWRPLSPLNRQGRVLWAALRHRF